MKNKIQKAILAKVAKCAKRAAFSSVSNVSTWDYYQPKIPDQLREKILKE